MSEKNNNTFESTVSSLFQGMDHFISSKTVVGDAITVGDTIILPLVDVSLAWEQAQLHQREKITEQADWEVRFLQSAVLVIMDGNIRLVNVKNQDEMTKVLDMVPDFVNKFTSGKKPDPEVDKADE